MSAAARGPLAQFAGAYAESRLALFGLALLAAIALVALLAPWLAPQNPYDLMALDILDSRLPPGSPSGDGRMIHRLGTDEQGRDMLSAIFYGLRISIMVGLSATVIALAIGMALGLVAGYFGGRFDTVLMRIADIQLSFPSILTAMILLALFGQGIDKIIIALVASQWAYYARTTRGAALVERRKEYIEAARLLGLS
nr:ABC transporter permease [Zoogloeaceae bacterium]